MPPTYSDDELLKGIRELADSLGKTPTVDDMKREGRFSYEAYRTRFGGWTAALKEAGCETSRDISTDRIIEGLREFAEELGRPPTQAEMNADGPFSVWIFRDRFGSWSEGKAAAGLSPKRLPTVSVSDEDLIAELKRLGEELGRKPTYEEMTSKGAYHGSTFAKHFGTWTEATRIAGFESRSRPGRGELVEELLRLRSNLERTPRYVDVEDHGEYSGWDYVREFGSFTEALLAADLEPNQRSSRETECYWCGKGVVRPPSLIKDHVFCGRGCFHKFHREFYRGERHWSWKGTDSKYGNHWERQRKAALRRDSFQCQRCGTGQEEHREEFDQGLHVHHDIPVGAFIVPGRGHFLDNLQTLCCRCHLQIERTRR